MPRSGEPEVVLHCRRHGETAFVVTGTPPRHRCKRCRSERVTQRRRALKRQLVAEAGGRCLLCGYDRFAGALQFHHVDPEGKAFALSTAGLARSVARARAEARKCVLLCANCHAEVEGGIATIPLTSVDDREQRRAGPVGGNSIGRMLGC
jgi:hypothetical protein